MSATATIKNNSAAKTRNAVHAPQAIIQPKLMVNEPGDRYEQEADAMADRVMRMPQQQNSAMQITSLIGQPVQRQCAHCEEEKKKKNNGGMIMRKQDNDQPAGCTPPITSISGSFVQRKCDHCEEEEKKQRSGTLMRKAESGGGFEASSELTSQLTSARGGGSPLPGSTRNFMEQAFSADFSNVRVHAGGRAASMNRQVNAKAFTYGNDIYFNEGEYSPGSPSGKKLLAHELTHVVQQGNIILKKIQKDEGASGSETSAAVQDNANTATNKEPEYVPETVISEFLDRIDEAEEREAAGDQDIQDDLEDNEDEEAFAADEKQAKHDQELDEAIAWVGTGVTALRKKILVEVELMRLENEGYRTEVMDTFFSENEDGGGEYLESVKTNIDAVAGGEKETLNSINASLHLGLDKYNFVDNWYMIQKNAANAFPEFAWAIVYPLIKPPDYLYSWMKTSLSNSQKDYYYEGPLLSIDMYANGLPVSYVPSLGLDHYSLIKMATVPKLFAMPTKAWMYERFILPEEVDLHTKEMRMYSELFTSYIYSAYQNTIYAEWLNMTRVRWVSFSTDAISNFRREHPTGLHNLEEFYNFQYAGAAAGLGILVNAMMNHYHADGTSPYLVFSTASKLAREKSSINLSQTVSAGGNNFHATLEGGDGMIKKLTPAIRFLTAVQWSFEKGFAEEGIYALLDNLDEILWNILKEWAKDKAIKKAVMTGVSYFGPWGKAISVLYNIWDFFDTAKDKIEIALLIKSFVDLLDEARSSETIIQTQRSAAKLAQAYETIFQQLIQRLGAALLEKLSSAALNKIKAKHDRNDKMSDARRHDLISESAQENDARKLNTEHLDAEVQAAVKSKATESDDPDYDAVISIPNSHTWKRIKGTHTWCRSSSLCTIPSLDNPQIAELDKMAASLPKAPSDTEDMGKQITDELGLDAPADKGRIDLSKSVRDAQAAGFVSQNGDPIMVDLAVQKHSDATDVRDAINTTGAVSQSAHFLPSSVGKQDANYSRRGALTVLLPTTTHRAFDDQWKQYAIQQRQNGVTQVPVSKWMDIMYKAIDNTPGLSQGEKGTMQDILRTEVYRDLAWTEADMIDLPYPNIN